MKKTEKTFFVENLTEELKSANAVVLVDYTGLNVSMQQDLKKRLSEVGAEMTVVKNTLFRIAGEKAKIPGEAIDDTVLSGPTAMVITEEDPIASLQALHRFAKEFDIPQFKVGIIEGSFRNKETLEKLSKLPSKEVLVGQAVGAIAGPMYGLVGTLNANMQNLVSILEQASKNK